MVLILLRMSIGAAPPFNPALALDSNALVGLPRSQA